MATPNPQNTTVLTPDERLAIEQQQRYENITRNLAIGGVIICPLIVIMPPRKLDLYTLSLGIGFYLSADHLSTSYTGRSLVQQLSPMRAVKGVELPTERAREMQKLIEDKERGRQALQEENRRREGADKQRMGVLEKIWMGDEKEGWRERRLEEERKALQEGKTYTSMILEQIWDVTNWDKKKGDEKSGEPKK